MNRCFWVNLNNPRYVDYHDKEWCVPSHDDNYLFEMLVLESFQAGLSWECILNKRDYFKSSFDNFDYKKISKYDESKILELLNNKNIIRNKLKIKATITNSKIFMDIQKEYGSFSNYIWSFTNNNVIDHNGEVITSNELSDTISKDLKKRVNDHDLNCDFRK